MTVRLPSSREGHRQRYAMFYVALSRDLSVEYPEWLKKRSSGGGEPTP